MSTLRAECSVDLPLVDFAASIPIWEWSEEDVNRPGAPRIGKALQQSDPAQVDQDRRQRTVQVPGPAPADYGGGALEAVVEGSRRAL